MPCCAASPPSSTRARSRRSRRSPRTSGTPILAYSCYQADAAPIDDGQIGRIKELEGKLGVALVAVRQ